MRPAHDPRVIGPVEEYLRALAADDPPEHDRVVSGIRALLNQPEAAILLNLLGNSVLLRTIPVTVSDGALRELNGARTLASELVRLKDASTLSERQARTKR